MSCLVGRPLSWAVWYRRKAVVKLLLEKGAELETKDNEYGQTPAVMGLHGMGARQW